MDLLSLNRKFLRRHYYMNVSIRGLKSPRLFKFPSFRRFRSFSFKRLLNAHRQKPSERREAQKANSRGFLNPWKN